ncbi:hypothetical protein [Fusobacterium necrophorum]|uniref:Uncharacterized protein n=1 Tax=Fusobacterium necrophorum TaxID=859 RepID=A0A4Q2L1G1_9FUSO|nr:hypothetical protein [Fusobacterium necrophorum]KYM49697.1 hypothetical protein A2U11_10250 [Fusobacterium necrophorum subsp. funduliforme]RXZ69821.1 hypothetical protein EPT53_05900 [Fusobacterium necrophorum]
MEEKESVEYAKIMATASAEKLSEYLKKLDISETETKKLIDLILEQVRDCIEFGKEIAYAEMISYMKDNVKVGEKNAD